MGHQELVADLVAAGYPAATRSVNGTEFVTFSYRVPVGARAGEAMLVGLQAPDWPVNPPGGPHVTPRIHHPGDNAHHQSPLGPDSIYWSRPHPQWTATGRTIGDYLAHLRGLFSQFEDAA